MTCCHRQQPRAHYINVCASLNNEVVICIIHKTTAWTAGWHWCALSSKLAVRRTSKRVSMSPPPPPSYSYTPGKWGYKQMNVIGRVRTHTPSHVHLQKRFRESTTLGSCGKFGWDSFEGGAKEWSKANAVWVRRWCHSDVTVRWRLWMAIVYEALHISCFVVECDKPASLVRMVHFIWQFEIAWPLCWLTLNCVNTRHI